MPGKPFETWIQDLVYNVDVGIGVKVTKTALYVLFVLIIAVMYQVSEFKGLKDPEAMDFAQLGRNLAVEGKLHTQYVRPASMWYLSQHDPETGPRIMDHPDLLHPPLYPALLAGAFKLAHTRFSMDGPPGIFLPESTVVLPLNHIFNALTGFFVFLLGLRLFERRVALLAATAFFLTNSVWAMSVSGNSVSLAMLMCTAALYFALGAIPDDTEEKPRSLRRRIASLVLALLFTALAFLTRYGTVVLVPALALLLVLTIRPRGWVWAAGFVLAFLLAISPWLARNQEVSGGPLGLAAYTALNNTPAFKGDTFERSMHPAVSWQNVAQPLQSKWLTKIGTYYQQTLTLLGNGLFAALFLSAFFYRFVRYRTHVLRWCVAVGIAGLLFLAGYFGDETAKLLHIFLPIAILYGSAFFFLLLDRLQLRLRIMDYVVTGSLLLLGAFPLILTLLPPRASLPYPPYFPPYIHHVSSLLTPDELMCTDMPWATAWYGQRSSVQLPVTLDEFYELNDYQHLVNGIYFTTITRDKAYISELATGPYKSWFPILQGQTPSDFPLTQGFPINFLDQLFLTDRVRWGAKE